MQARLTIAVVTVAVVAAAGAYALTRDAEQAVSRHSGPSTVEITAYDFGFDVPETVDAGPVEVRFRSRGQQPHHGFIYALREGVSFDEFKSGVMQDDRNVPKLSPGWDIAMSRAIGKGDTFTYKGELEPGTYAVACFIKDEATAKNHAQLGMITKLEVR